MSNLSDNKSVDVLIHKQNHHQQQQNQQLSEKDLVQEIKFVQDQMKSLKSKTLLTTGATVIFTASILIMVIAQNFYLADFQMQGSPTTATTPTAADVATTTTTATTTRLNTGYFVQNLQGTSVDSGNFYWNLAKGTTLTVNLRGDKDISVHRQEIIINAITSKESITVEGNEDERRMDDRRSDIIPTKSYLGWAGALDELAKHDTKYFVPTKINVVQSNLGEGHLIILLSNLKDNDGRAGYTRLTVENNQILKALITIFDFDNIGDEELALMVRHELGHALGLGHNTMPDDLMNAKISTDNPNISACNIEALKSHFNGLEEEILCDK